MNERIEWTNQNHEFLSRIAIDPEGTIPEWSTVEEPWCFIAAVLEYYQCVILGHKRTSGLPVSVDATCSGLQHLSALALDRTAAEMVNVVPTDKPSVTNTKGNKENCHDYSLWGNRKQCS
mgnify:CR=1 FL=1